MVALRSIVTAFSTFSRIPMPRVAWRDANMRYMMAAFPLVGIVIGAFILLWWQICTLLHVGGLLRAAGLTLLPIALSGGIHMDGLTDVTDALSSHASPKRKREILKDPHAGAFAALGVCCYLIAYLALASEVDTQQRVLVACIPVISRCLCGFVGVAWKPFSTSGMLASVQTASNIPATRIILAALLGLTTMATAVLSLPTTLAMICAAGVMLAWLRRISSNEFGGMNGDLLGFFLQMAELSMLAAVVIVGKLV